MNNLSHEQVRELISAEERTDEVRAHLASCADCSEWNASLERIREAAPNAIPPAPSDLFDRVNAAYSSNAPGGTWPRWLGVRALIAAGVAAAVAAVIVAVPRSHNTDRGGAHINANLVAAIHKTEALHTALFDVDGGASFKPGKPIAFPTPAMSFPVGFPSSLATPNPFPSMPQMQGFSITMRGSGETVLPDRWHLRAVIEGSVFGRSSSMNIEMISIGSTTWEKNDFTHGKWMELPAPTGFQVHMDPGSLLELAKQHGASDLGTEMRDGTSVEHFRASSNSGNSGSSTVDLWIGTSDGIVHELNAVMHSAVPGGGSSEAHMHLRLHNFGANVTVKPPTDVVSFRSLLGAPSGSFGGLNFSFNVTTQQQSYTSHTFAPTTTYSYRPYQFRSIPPQYYPSQSPEPSPR
ncbi:MAG: hypothetical protein ACYDCC_01465 [Actinomycetota bacterium]